ncbi:hypothetical protein F2P81_017481 [Scophthalmus maximus]|uniref:Uncharacterized protein n=1 Tax=Scophthalmus maximus TaxID=52904 RepID=A0A6A4SFV1_SCOMX|nr:hypothetical protein F2P81_017481 [Scophthalmus maximus]
MRWYDHRAGNRTANRVVRGTTRSSYRALFRAQPSCNEVNQIHSLTEHVSFDDPLIIHIHMDVNPTKHSFMRTLTAAQTN